MDSWIPRDLTLTRLRLAFGKYCVSISWDVVQDAPIKIDIFNVFGVGEVRFKDSWIWRVVTLMKLRLGFGKYCAFIPWNIVSVSSVKIDVSNISDRWMNSRRC